MIFSKKNLEDTVAWKSLQTDIENHCKYIDEEIYDSDLEGLIETNQMADEDHKGGKKSKRTRKRVRKTKKTKNKKTKRRARRTRKRS